MQTRWVFLSWVFAIGLGAGCGSSGTPATTGPENQPNETVEQRFQREAEAFYWAHLDGLPQMGVGMGYHQYDGKLPDPSPHAIAARIAMYRAAEDKFSAISADELSPQSQVEREVLLNAIRNQLFDVEVLMLPMRNPILYMFGSSLMPYVSRDYAPLAQRAQAIIAMSQSIGPFLSQAQKNLPEVMPRTWLQIALLQSKGMIEFAKTDVAKAMTGLEEPLASELKKGLQTYAAAVQGYHDFLQQRTARASDEFALGKDLFLRMLRDKEGLDITLERLTAIGEADLKRNLAAMVAAARKIDPNRESRQVIEEVKNLKPSADGVLTAATEQSAALRQFLIDKKIVTIPSPDLAEVKASPPFMRFNSAFLDSAGVFESKALPSFYFISPPDPKWPAAQRQAYIPSFGDLHSTSVHELWPGHFLHHLHRKKNPSKILKTFCTYTNVEGWAHYTEEMMWLQGATGDDPKMHIGQLSDALLRNVRYKSAIALHTGGATVDQARQWFAELGYQDEGNSMQQAVRGTFDPGYLNYTLGKLMIMKLHDDWKAKMAAQYSLSKFHDEFLSHGCAPVPVIRHAMLGDDSPPL